MPTTETALFEAGIKKEAGASFCLFSKAIRFLFYRH